LQAWARGAGLPSLSELGVSADMHAEIVQASASASSMKGNPVALSEGALRAVLESA
jgi:alcohol dehydrogenase class IV